MDREENVEPDDSPPDTSWRYVIVGGGILGAILANLAVALYYKSLPDDKPSDLTILFDILRDGFIFGFLGAVAGAISAYCIHVSGSDD